MRARPMLRSFNGGVFSPIMAGRSDLNRYASSMRRMFNTVALPQGPTIRRSGTKMIVPVYDETKGCQVLPFVFGFGQNFNLEFQSGFIRFVSDNGLLTYAPSAITALAVSAGFLQITSAALTVLGAIVSDEVALDGFPAATGLSGLVVKITGVAGDDYTTDFSIASVAGIAGVLTGALAYHVPQPYDDADTPNLRGVQLLDRMYLFCEGYRTRRLDRSGTYDWQINFVNFIDGPYLPTIADSSGVTVTPSAVGPLNVTWTFNKTTGINGGAGLLATDVGRSVRIKDATTADKWAWFKITSVTNTKVCKGDIQGAALSGTGAIHNIRFGYFCNTLGWPNVGRFAQDRLWLGNIREQPDLLTASFVGGYENFSQTDPDGTVNADNALCFPLNDERVSPIQWIRTQGKKSIIIGTQLGPWIFEPSANDQFISALNPSAARATSRGMAFIDPVQADSGMLYIDKTKKVLRECVYSLAADNFVTPPMSIYSSHLGTPHFEQIIFLGEPHSIAMIRRGDGTIAGFTYNREEDVLGWHEHDFGGSIETLTSLPSADGASDVYWMTIRRVINGNVRRFHERMEPFWSFESTLDTAWYVDCGLRYEGAPASVFYVPHLAGATVYGLADGAPILPITVALDGRIELPAPASNFVVGLGFGSWGETNNLEFATPTGTAQGKQKRVESAKIRLWQSGGGRFGKGAVAIDGFAEETYPLPTRRMEDPPAEAVPLRSYDTDDIVWPADFSGDCTIVFGQPPEIPLPINVVAIMPQIQFTP